MNQFYFSQALVTSAWHSQTSWCAQERDSMIPYGLWGALASIFLYVGTSIKPFITIHIASYHTYFNHTSYLLLKCDYFHIENVLQALFISIFLVNLLEWNALQSHATVLKQKLANKQSHYWNILPWYNFHTWSCVKI